MFHSHVIVSKVASLSHINDHLMYRPVFETGDFKDKNRDKNQDIKISCFMINVSLLSPVKCHVTYMGAGKCNMTEISIAA